MQILNIQRSVVVGSFRNVKFHVFTVNVTFSGNDMAKHDISAMLQIHSLYPTKLINLKSKEKKK